VPAAALVRLAFLRDSAPMSQIDAALRDRGVSAMSGLPGVLESYAARRGPDRTSERVLASIWSSQVEHDEAMSASASETALAELDESVAQSIEVIPVVIGLRFRQASPARVLRVFRGEIREGMTDRYLSAARAGAIRDAESGEGPHGYFLGLVDDHRFVSVSVWPSWDEIQQVTGGTSEHPVATRHAEMLRAGTAQHFEILTPSSHDGSRH
jgi:heme-degrading monooxygenase HmoA